MASITTAEKPTLSYRVVAGIDPQDRTKTILRPLIVNKESYDTARTLRFAMENKYVTAGQFFSNFGIVNGFLEAVQRLGKDGRDVHLNGWLRIHPELRGTINPETRLLGADNEVHVCIQAQSDLRRKAEEFNWTCVEETGIRATIQHLQALGGANDKEILTTSKIIVSGTNLTYTEGSDTITMSWQTIDEATDTITDHSVNVTPESSGYSAMILPVPEELSEAPVGTVVTFTFFLRRGNSEASVIPAVAKATIVSAA
jgi:hypothetical protein